MTKRKDRGNSWKIDRYRGSVAFGGHFRNFLQQSMGVAGWNILLPPFGRLAVFQCTPICTR